jgi:hypothetical protein
MTRNEIAASLSSNLKKITHLKDEPIDMTQMKANKRRSQQQKENGGLGKR